MLIPQVLQEILSAVATALAPVILGAIQRRLKERARSKDVEQVRLNQLSSFLAFDVRKRDRLIVEQQFRTTFGTLYEYREILCILEGRSPLKALATMRTVRHLVNFDVARLVFDFKASYATAQQRIWKRRLFFTAYAISVYAALGPWYFAERSLVSSPTVLALLFSTAFFFLMAWAILDLATDISAAERFLAAVEPFSAIGATVAPAAEPEPSTSITISIVR